MYNEYKFWVCKTKAEIIDCLSVRNVYDYAKLEYSKNRPNYIFLKTDLYQYKCILAFEERDNGTMLTVHQRLEMGHYNPNDIVNFFTEKLHCKLIDSESFFGFSMGLQ